MRFITHLIATSVLTAITGAALAQEATPDTWITPSTKSRAEVLVELQAAVRNGAMPRRGEGPFIDAPSPRSTLTRAQVSAEAREAKRLGLIPYGEAPMHQITAAQAELIRLAGLCAVGASDQIASK